MKASYHGSSSLTPTKIKIEEDQWTDIEASGIVGVLGWDSTAGVFKYNTSTGIDTYIPTSTTAGYGNFGNGTVLLPSVTFSNDLDCGIYRIGTNNLGVAVNATKILDIATTGLSVVGTITASTTALATTFDTNVAAAGVTLVGTTLSADGTDAAIPITITPKGAAGILTAAGLVGTPAYSFTDQTDMGFYKVSGTQLGVSTSGTLATLFDSAGLKSDSVMTRASIGTTPVGTVSFLEYGDGRDMTTVLTLTNFIVGALAGAGAALGVGNIVYAFPAGQHAELVYSLSSIVLTAAGTPVNTDTGLGSVIATGAVSTLDGTATFEDRLTGQTIATAAAGGSAVSTVKGATAGIGTGIALNIDSSVKNVFLNSAGTWNEDNTGNLTASGTIVLKWTMM